MMRGMIQLSRAEVEADITATMGLVPSFFDSIPDDLIGAEWKIFKTMTFGETAIPNKYGSPRFSGV